MLRPDPSDVVGEKCFERFLYLLFERILSFLAGVITHTLDELNGDAEISGDEGVPIPLHVDKVGVARGDTGIIFSQDGMVAGARTTSPSDRSFSPISGKAEAKNLLNRVLVNSTGLYLTTLSTETTSPRENRPVKEPAIP